MTEFTKDITPINIGSTPQFEAPTSNLGTDIANLLGTGLEVFVSEKNKQREIRTNQLMQNLSDYEVELTSNNLSRSEVLSRLDTRIKELAPDANQQSFLRNRLAQKRGGFVSNQIVQALNNEETQRQQTIERDYQQALSVIPELRGSVKRDERGMVSEQEKLRIISQSQDRILNNARAAREAAIAQEQLTQAGQQAVQGAQKLSESLNITVSENFRPLADNYISLASNLNIESPENMQLFQEAKSNLSNVGGILRQQIESQYNSALTGTSNTDARKLIEENRDAALSQLDGIFSTLNSADVDQSKKIAANLDMLQNTLKLNSLESFSTAYMLEQVAPNAGTYLVQELYAKQPQAFDAIRQELNMGLSTLSGDQITTQFANQVMGYMEDNDPTKVNDLVLSTFYDTTKSILNAPNGVQDLTSEELNKVSGGLIGILDEAANTDNPQQIKEATKMLNSENFETFFMQLPENRKAALGRFITGFNQDVLVDSTDGIFKTLGDLATTSSITYNAETGMFEAPKAGERSPQAGAMGGLFGTLPASSYTDRNAQREVKKANTYLENIRKMSQYDTSGLDSRTLVDTMIQRYLPQDIKVQGTLKPYVAPEREDVIVNEVNVEDTRLDNEVIIRELQSKISELESKLISR